MATLVEAAAAVSVAGAILLLVTTALAASARIDALCASVGAELVTDRQLEQLLDRASLASGAGPAHPPAISSLSADTVVFGSDQNGDGVVDTTSSETTALEVRMGSGTTSVRVRLGRQTMTVLDAGDDVASVAGLDRYGNATAAASARLVELTLIPTGDDAGATRTMLFTVPMRMFQ